ncbi:MAG: hypothetical protein PHH26_05015, partial [Candidatus Thermoplasmatota archaeon]|nr:hypothetical protein [Candidatus Thermoplasmatota archaeon]
MAEKRAKEIAKFPLGVFTKGKRTFRFYTILRKGETLLKMESSLNGINFRSYPRNAEIIGENGKENISKCKDLKISEIDGKYVLTYLASSEKGTILCTAVSKDGIHWEKLGAKPSKPISAHVPPAPALKKSAENPILKPDARHAWESRYVFNPAAIHEGGKTHLVYRAIGENDVSVFGYASSTDGIHFEERLEKPIYVPTQPFETGGNIYSCHAEFMSGGGYGGCEDPRITKIGDRIYMTYVAFDGSNPPRVALTSIKVDDFLSKKWNWKKPVLISPPGTVDKNACIFPEKIKDKYVVFHRIFPNILIDFVDDLEFDGNRYLKGEYAIKPTENGWDSRKIGVGPPPIKTKDGWLVIYQAVGDKDPHYRYKIGAMLLDARDPTKVLFRTKEPILEPSERYEMEGFKPGVTYPCGAVVIGGDLHVYYGSA